MLAAAKLMDRFQVEYNILSTVNLDVAKNIDRIYYFFKKQRFRYLQFIPCLDELNGEPREYSLTPEAYGEFLIRLFRLWYVDLSSGRPVSVRYFDNLLMMLGGYPPESCGMAGVCGSYYMIEADGSAYPCDFYVTDEWRIGNILTDGLEEMRHSETARQFLPLLPALPGRLPQKPGTADSRREQSEQALSGLPGIFRVRSPRPGESRTPLPSRKRLRAAPALRCVVSRRT